MSDEMPVKPGTTSLAVVRRVEGGILLALEVTRPDGGSLLVPARLGSIRILPGYERVSVHELERVLPLGHTVQVTWIGFDPTSGLPDVSLSASTWLAERTVIENGWALPTEAVLALPATRLGFESAVTSAARNQNGAWGDLGLRPELEASMALPLANARHLLAPTFIDANPGLAGIMLLVVVGGVVLSLARDRAVTELERGADAPKQGRLAWLLDLHTRFLRPSRRRTKDSAKPHA